LTRAFSTRKSTRAFTLIEVMIAMAVFFVVVFSILNVVVQSLGQARSLQKRHADPGMIAAMLTLTNCMEEASDSGDFADLGELYANQHWMWESAEVGSNMLWRVRIAVFEKLPNGREAVEEMEVEFAKPGCTGAGMRR
jgi:prepilin-type N-terminal cleavage/methylation domain-containing protein